MPIKVIPTLLDEIIIIEPSVFGDDRGFFYESFNLQDFRRAVGHSVNFVQDNHSKSGQGVLRGLHYQIKHPQGKLVRVIKGVVFDVAVDIRRSSPSFGKWVGVELSAENKRQLWIPTGFAHGFLVLSKSAEFLYKTTDFWYPQDERVLLWSDPMIGIDWPSKCTPKLSEKDKFGKNLNNAELFD